MAARSLLLEPEQTAAKGCRLYNLTFDRLKARIKTINESRVCNFPYQRSQDHYSSRRCRFVSLGRPLKFVLTKRLARHRDNGFPSPQIRESPSRLDPTDPLRGFGRESRGFTREQPKTNSES